MKGLAKRAIVHQIQRLFHPSAGEVAVATLLVPILSFRTHVSSHNRNNSAGHRNRLHERGTTHSIHVQAAQRSRFISEEAGWDRTRGGGDDQRNTLCYIRHTFAERYVNTV